MLLCVALPHSYVKEDTKAPTLHGGGGGGVGGRGVKWEVGGENEVISVSHLKQNLVHGKQTTNVIIKTIINSKIIEIEQCFSTFLLLPP